MNRWMLVKITLKHHNEILASDDADTHHAHVWTLYGETKSARQKKSSMRLVADRFSRVPSHP
jgi:hypothetical protein